MYIQYDKHINKYNKDEASLILRITILELFGTKLDHDGIEILTDKYYNLAAKDVSSYKDNMKKYHNSEKDFLYKDIESHINSDDEQVILFIKSSLVRLHDWFLLDRRQLELAESIPPVLDKSIQVFKDYSENRDILKQSKINHEFIKEFLGHDISIDLSDLMKKADKEFLRLNFDNIRKFRVIVNKSKLRKRTTNKSKSFYNINVDGMNSYIDNLFEYESNLKYYKYISRVKDHKYVKLPGNYDYIKYILIKNKGMATRHIFFTSSQVNSFLKPFNDAFEKAFKQSEYLGVYDQDKAVNLLTRKVESLLSTGVKFSVLSLDFSKYSDTLPIALIYHVLNLMLDNESLSDAICECLNLPVLHKGELCYHNATLQGVYFDFSIITMVNLYIQIATAIACGKKILYLNVVGDDAVLILADEDNTLYSKIGREISALFGCVVNKSKMISCNQSSGFITYLKYYSEIRNSELVNLSGLSPGLWLKNVISFNRINSIIAYLRKSQYITRDYIPYDMISLFVDRFNETIFNFYNIINVDKETIAYFKSINIVEAILDRPQHLGGFKVYENSVVGREKLVNDIKRLKMYYSNIFHDPNDTSIPLIEEICRQVDIDVKDTCLSEDLNMFISEEYAKIYQKLRLFLKESDSYIKTGESQFLDEAKSLLKNLNDRKFDKYKSSGLTTDRTSEQHFEDSYLIDEKIGISTLEEIAYLRSPTNMEQKQIYNLAVSYLNEYRSIRKAYNDSDNLFLEISKGTVPLINRYHNNRYVSFYDIKYSFKNDEKLRSEVVSSVINSVPEKDRDKVRRFLMEKPERALYVLEEIDIAGRRYKKVEDIVKEAYDKVFDKVKEKIFNKIKKKQKNKVVNKIHNKINP